ncbi:melanopsin isoform X1 [Daphnia magna]|uniref:melanopsin isoform X1 n=2 Tax=Daphnia magna TaxID=35525 RepID=UPI001E1BB5B1|nr:melanopsin isoform X1 [Daphnia magna]
MYVFRYGWDVVIIANLDGQSVPPWPTCIGNDHGHTQMKIAFNVSLFLQDAMDVVAGLVESNVLVNGSLNTSNQTDGDERVIGSLLMPVWAYQSAAAYLVFISVVGLFMNVLVIIVILNDPVKMTALNWMLLNLACSDGIIAGFGAPISASAALQLDWPFSDELCIAYAMIMSTAGIGSITTLTALALWRCQLVVYCPAKRSNAFANNNNGGRLGHCRAVFLLASIWTYSLAVTCPPLFGWGRYDREAAHISCSVNWESKMDNNRLYIVYMFAFGLFVPLAVIVISYVSILRVVKKTKEMRRKTQAAVTGYKHESQQVITARTTSRNHPVNRRQSRRVIRNVQKMSSTDAAEKRVTVMVACMVGAFLTAWTPYSILALFETFTGEMGLPSNGNFSWQGNGNELRYVGTISPGFATIPSLFAKTSAVLNPLIYGLLNTQFRAAWDKFSIRFLGRRHRQSEAAKVDSGCKRRKNWRQLFERATSPTLKPSATVRLSMKQIHFDESQSIYVLANPRPLIASPPVGRLVQRAQHQRQPSPTRMSSSMADDETTIVHQPSIQMRSFNNSELQERVLHQQEAAIKLAVVSD